MSQQDAENLEDAVLLARLVYHDRQLTEHENTAFRCMIEKGTSLTHTQRDWAEQVYRRNSLAAKFKGASTKKPPVVREPYFWELKENRPLKPPR